MCINSVCLCAQVQVLELETRLQRERERLGELRKKHYELAGVAEGWGEEEEGELASRCVSVCVSVCFIFQHVKLPLSLPPPLRYRLRPAAVGHLT